MPTASPANSEWLTRKRLVDGKLAAAGRRVFSTQVDVVKEQTTRDFVPISEQYLLFHRVPPLTEQQEIVHRVDELFAIADAIESQYKKAQMRVDRLSQSILAKAFQGELAPTEAELAEAEGGSFESAGELLNRIRNSGTELVADLKRKPARSISDGSVSRSKTGRVRLRLPHLPDHAANQGN